MKSIVLIVITLLFATLFVYIVSNRRRIEGFVDTKAVDNALLNVMGQLKRVSGYLADPRIWSERLAMTGMSPVELARHYINSNTKSRGNAKA